VFVNERPAKSALELKLGDKVHLELGSRAITVEVKSVLPVPSPFKKHLTSTTFSKKSGVLRKFSNDARRKVATARF